MTILAAALLLGVTDAVAKVRPHQLIGDNMVVQQQSDARLFGWADPGSPITVTTSWDGKKYTASTDRTGRWELAVRTPAASFTPYTITISDGEPLTINNVLVGEVWLASGQSNMQMPLKGYPGCCLKDGYEEISNSRDQQGRIRFFTVPLTQSYTPMDTVAAAWTLPSPETSPEYSALAWHYAKRLSSVLDVPVGIVSAAYGGAKVESFLPREIVEEYSDISLDPKEMEKMVHYYRPYLMYNSMFNPVKDYTYKGIIWYQGCSNTSSYETYADRLETMVKRWRDDIGLGEIPFYSVETAPFDYDNPAETGKAPLLREAQRKAMENLPNSGIIGINDLVEPFEKHNIHPGNKADVGKRLANLALNKTYGQKQFPVVHPRYRSHEFKNGEVWVSIDSPDGGICRNYDIRGFEVAGPDKVFHPADNVWVHWQTNEIVVSSKDVPEPVAVRYCWRDFLPGTMHGADYLPLIPFRTDNW